MPFFDTTSVLPRQELALAVVEGEGAIGGLIGDKILPDYPITRRTAHIIKAALAGSQALRSISAAKYIRAPGTKFERITATLGDDTFTVVLRGVELVIPNETQMDYDGYLTIEALYAARFGNEVSGLTKEQLIEAAIFNTGTFGAATNSATAYTVANLATMTPVADLIAATRRLKAKGEPPPYSVAMSGPVWERIRQCTDTRNFLVGSLKGQTEVTRSALETALREFGITQILVGDAYVNTAADSATPSLSPIWTNTYIWTGRPGMAKGIGTPEETNPETDEKEGFGVPILGGVGANIFWQGWANGMPSDEGEVEDFEGGNYVESYYVREIDSEVLRLKLSSQPYLGNPRAGDLVATQYS